MTPAELKKKVHPDSQLFVRLRDGGVNTCTVSEYIGIYVKHGADNIAGIFR
jgi:hypothetical protein